MIKYIDIHSHLNLPEFNEDRDLIIKKIKEADILTITVGADFLSSVGAISLAEEHANLFASVGIHPSYALSEEFDYEKMINLAKNKKVVSIGECGLDYFRNNDNDFKNKQRELFLKHILLSLEVEKPLMIHARSSAGTMDAYSDVLDILEKYKKDNSVLMANFHFFAGDKNILNRILALGFSVSFDGPITFSRDYDDVIRETPLDFIMAETDAPYAAPAPYRGKRCEPQMVSEMYKKIAEIKGIDEEHTREQIIKNAQRIFKI